MRKDGESEEQGNMSEELYTLYREDADFREYVDRWCKQHNLSIFEAFQFNLIREYAKYVKEGKKK